MRNIPNPKWYHLLIRRFCKNRFTDHWVASDEVWTCIREGEIEKAALIIMDLEIIWGDDPLLDYLKILAFVIEPKGKSNLKSNLKPNLSEKNA